MRIIFVSLYLKPSFSMLFLMSGRSCFEVGIDQDVAPRCVDQVDGQIGSPDIVQIPRDLKRWKLGVPIRIALRQQRWPRQQRTKEALVASLSFRPRGRTLFRFPQLRIERIHFRNSERPSDVIRFELGE